MTPGFLLESTDHGGRGVTKWVEGAPEKSIWTGLRLGERQVLPVVTFRCLHCGYLESYAFPPTDAPASAG